MMNLIESKIKICGIRCPYVASQSVKIGADYVGIVFHKDSKRNIDEKNAKNVVMAVKKYGAFPVAVFVNQTAEEMISICNNLSVDIVQLHGVISREQHEKLPSNITRIYTLNIGSDGRLIQQHESLLKHLNSDRDFLLFDGPYAGSGRKIPTNHLNEISKEFNFFIAGGLNSLNVQETIQSCKPFAVDVSSGVEGACGDKDMALVEEFIRCIKRRRSFK